MNTQTKKIDLTQRILNINNDKILVKISKLIDNENIIGYDIDGNPISEKDYVSDINNALQLYEEGKLETYSSQEVKNKILV